MSVIYHGGQRIPPSSSHPSPTNKHKRIYSSGYSSYLDSPSPRLRVSSSVYPPPPQFSEADENDNVFMDSSDPRAMPRSRSMLTLKLSNSPSHSDIGYTDPRSSRPAKVTFSKHVEYSSKRKDAISPRRKSRKTKIREIKPVLKQKSKSSVAESSSGSEAASMSSGSGYYSVQSNDMDDNFRMIKGATAISTHYPRETIYAASIANVSKSKSQVEHRLLRQQSFNPSHVSSSDQSSRKTKSR